MAKTREYMDYLDERIGIAPAYSQEECQAGEVISRIMREHGLQTSVEEFDGRGSGTVARNVLVIVMFIAALVGGLVPDVLHIVLLLVALSAAALLAFMHFVRNVFEDLGPAHRSQNVVGIRRAPAENVVRGSRPIVIVAHYDTPRESVMRRGILAHYQSTLVRVAAVCPAVVAVALLFQVMMFMPEPVRIFMWVVGLIASLPALFVAVASIVSNFGECTLGSNDNKASVAALLGMVDKVSPAEDHATVAAKQRPAKQRRRRADGPAEPAEPQVRRVTVVEEVYGVRHGEDVLRAVGILPPSCEIVYEEPKVTVMEEPLESWDQSEAMDGVDETGLADDFESDDYESDYESDDSEGSYEDDAFEEDYDDDYEDEEYEDEDYGVDSYEDDGYEDDEDYGDDDFGDASYDSDYDEYGYEEDEEPASESDRFVASTETSIENREDRLASLPSLDTDDSAYDDETGEEEYSRDGYDDEYVDEDDFDDDEYADEDEYAYDDEEDDDYDYAYDEDEREDEDEHEYEDEETLGDEGEEDLDADAGEYDYESEADRESEEEEVASLDDSRKPMGSAIGGWFSKRFQVMKEFLTYDDDESGSGGWISDEEDSGAEESHVVEEPSVDESAEVLDEEDVASEQMPSESYEEAYANVEDEVYDADGWSEVEKKPLVTSVPRIEDEPVAGIAESYEDDPDAMADLAFDAEQQGEYEDDFEYEEDEPSYYSEPAYADDEYEQEYSEDEQSWDEESYEDEDLTDEDYPLDEDSDTYDDEYYDTYEDEDYLLDEDSDAYGEEEYEEEKDVRREVRKEKKPSFAQRILGVFGGGRRKRAAKQKEYAYEEDEEENDGDEYYLEDEDTLDDGYETDDQETGHGEEDYGYLDEEEYPEDDDYLEDDDYTEDDSYLDEDEYLEDDDYLEEDGYFDEEYESDQDEYVEAPQQLVDPNSLHFDREEDDDDIVARDDSGLSTISDSYDLYTGDVKRESQRTRPASIDDPTWGTSTYQPTRPALNIARRAALYDLPDPSGSTVDPLADEFEYEEDVLATSEEAERTEARGGFWGEGAGNPRSQAWKGGATMREDIRQDNMGDFDGELQDAMLELGDDFLDQHDIWFVATGASEQDHAGMKAFLDAHRKEIRGAFLVNLECVGAGSLAVYAREGLSDRRRADRRLVRMASDIARDLHISVDTAMCDWTDTDAAVAMRSRVRAMSIVGLDENDLPALSHTIDDVPENVSPDQVDDVVRIVTEIIRRA